MPLATGTWCLTKIEDAIRDAIASSSAFQVWTGSADSAEALLHVHVDEVDQDPASNDTYSDAEMSVLFPLVVIEPDEDGDSILYQHFSGDFNQGFSTGWSLSLRFLDLFGAGSVNTQRRDLKNSIGEIIKDLREYPNLRIETLQPVAFPQLTHLQDAEESGQLWEWFWAIKDQTGIG